MPPAVDWSKAVPGDHVVVWYNNDDVWHEGLLGWPLGVETWVIRTTDGDVCAETLEAGGRGTVVQAVHSV